MLQRIIQYSVTNKLIIAILILILVVVGIYQTTKLPIDAVPDITDNQVLVITQAASFGATDIERLITFPIEQATSNIAGLKEIRSFSRFGLSLVTIVFNDNIDVYWARQQVAERLQQVQSQIPHGIGTPELGPISTGLGEIYQYVVKPKKGYKQKIDATELRTIQDWIIRRQLLGVKGVAEVSSFGGKLKQYEIAINPDKLNAYGITIHDVYAALENNNQNTGGGYIEKGPTVLYIRSEGLIKNIDDIKNIVIPNAKNSTTLFIKDVADIHIGYATRYGAICYNDEGEVSGAIVMMLKGANSSEVIKNVKERIEQIKTTLPEGVEVEPFLDRTKMVNNAIGTVKNNLIEGALIVVFVLVLFLGNIRAGLLVASVIPLAMLFAICMMNMFGVSGNLMSLGALDFGLIVDGAVIIVEAVMHQMLHTRNNNSNNEMAIDSSSKMMNSAVFGQLIILIVYLPIFSLQGIEGKMFKPMAQTVCFALLGAFLLSLTYIPMMSALVLSFKEQHKESLSDKYMQMLQKFFSKKLCKVLRFPKIAIAIVASLFVVACILLSQMGGEFIPSLEEGDFAVDTRVLTGSNLNTTIEYTQKAAHALKATFPEVDKVVTKIGSGEVPTDPMPMEASDMMVILKDKKTWTSAKTFDALADTMSSVLQQIPGITAGFQYPVQMRFNELMTGARQDVVCKIFGENLDTLANSAATLSKTIATIKGVENIYIEPITGMPQVIIQYNRTALAQYQLSIADVNKVVNTTLAGQSTGLLFEDEKRFDIVVRMQAKDKKSVEDIQNVLIPTPNGLQIPLSQVALVEIKDGPNQIQREDAKRRIVVGFNIKNRDVQSIVQELQQKVKTTIKFPVGYYVTYGGSFENLLQAKNRLMIAVPISLILIFVLLYFAFNNVKQGLLIYTAIPLSAIGGILFLFLRNMPFSISAGIGFIALFGVAVLNGIVLIAEFNRLKNSGIQSLPRIVLSGTSMRLRPVLMTAFVASLGFLPMALSNGSGAEVQRPLATVVIGGLLIATFLTLFLLPLLYIISEMKSTSNRKIKKISTLLVILFSTSIVSNAQQEISLQDALRIAVENNAQLKNEQLKAEYSKALIASSKIIPNTNIYSEFGQVNSPLFDTKIGVSQNFLLPNVNRANKEVLEQEYKTSILQTNIKEIELKKWVTRIFYEYCYLVHKDKVILQAQERITNFYEKAALRLQKGETNVLEKTMAENQKITLDIQHLQVQQELQVCLLQFQLVVNATIKYIPKVVEENLEIATIDTATHATKTPQYLLLQQQKNTIQAQKLQQQSKILPEIMTGINNTSFRGVGANNKEYKMYNRFTSAQIGLSFPLQKKAIKQKIASYKIAAQILQNSADNYATQQQGKLEKLYIHLQAQKEIIALYKTIQLPNAKKIYETANKQYVYGEINYLDYATLLNQSTIVESNYIEALHILNQTIIEINYLSE